MDYTTRLLLQKPDPDPVTGDFLDVSVLNANFDEIDAALGFTLATSGSPVPTPYQGQPVLETDTGKARVWGGSAYKQLLIEGAQYDARIGLGRVPSPFAARLMTTWGSGGGSVSQFLLQTSASATGHRALSVMGGADTQDRWWVDFDGSMQWSSGSAGGDISLKRAAAGVLDINTGTLTVGGTHPAVPGSRAKYGTPGTFTWTKPARARWVRVRIVGGGGSGGGAVAPASGQHSKGGGGGGGCYAELWFDAIDLTSTVSVTVGAGAAGVSGANGNTGGTTYFGPTGSPYLSASGGLGGIMGGSSSATWGNNGGNGGSTATGAPDITISGSAGGSGFGGGQLCAGGPGGSSALGGGGAGSQVGSAGSEVAGQAATGPGGGGGGAASAATGLAMPGGAGGAGLVIVETYY